MQEDRVWPWWLLSNECAVLAGSGKTMRFTYECHIYI